VAIELDHQADVVWNVDGNPDPERLLGRQLPINAKAFLLDPECLPRMANSARYMSAALERNDHWPMARCTADEIGVFLATTTAAHTVADTASEDPIAERLVGRLTPQAVVLAVRDLPDHMYVRTLMSTSSISANGMELRTRLSCCRSMWSAQGGYVPDRW